MELLDRITVNPAIRFGKPCVRGTRLTVGDVLGTLAAGCSEAELLEDFPQLTHEDVLACMAFAAERERTLMVSTGGGLSIKLLLDENLSERLLPLLSEAFPGSTHIRLLGLGGVDDRAVWDEARSSGSLLLTKDDDFLGMSMSLGWPPKVICLAIGNASNAATAQLILSRVSEIGYFHKHPEVGFLLLKPASEA